MSTALLFLYSDHGVVNITVQCYKANAIILLTYHWPRVIPFQKQAVLTQLSEHPTLEIFYIPWLHDQGNFQITAIITF